MLLLVLRDHSISIKDKRSKDSRKALIIERKHNGRLFVAGVSDSGTPDLTQQVIIEKVCTAYP
jgi:hypothetical protein